MMAETPQRPKTAKWAKPAGMPELPALTEAEFARKLEKFWRERMPAATLHRLRAHYDELRRWAGTVALVGPGAVGELFERHYAESLAALPWLPAGPGRLLDLGSGAGFPGWILAAARPDLEATLIEARERKWAFLSSAARRAQLSCHCLNVRVSAHSSTDLPAGVERIDVVTVRALRLEATTWLSLLPRLAPGAQVLLWSGEVAPALPPPFVAGRSLALSGSRRFLREYGLPTGLPSAR